MKVTIKDVAREAKVSPSTVSRVLSNNPRISDETKQKVYKVIEKLKYKPNAIARGLVNNKTRILGVVLPEEAENLLSNPFFIQAMKGISSSAEKREYYVTYAFSSNKESERKHIRDLTSSGLIEGMLILRPKENDENIKYLKDIDFPFVIMGRLKDIEGVLWVDNDNFKAMYNIVNKLIDKGHTKIALIGANRELNVCKDREKGYKVALEMNGISFNKKLVSYGEEFKEKEGYVQIKKVLENIEPTAVVAMDDLLAIGVMKALKEKNLNNISIVGFNNIPLCEFQKPALASVDINGVELGYYATKLLIDNIEAVENSREHYIIETTFVQRESFR
ncbi:DNA-binding LacI/PurR family transcriptional regulator [Clostridium tetanomorphum]|uniref:LacI family transcriptional regulator n=1 Tax=Clostridium tetanomorphum TaxID=1553 RepID=A0A923IYR5_CLOTT|nr:LacI family DNA-binding transcriptional regulator [Clostridium tetanomorphum]KAJ50266.1 LacI family transcriptional regulator [Clostridium tetanomorphum DSM 665]MBC2396177.1 LacI family transcriptional regulator [Clostridium tetanomorphum]MBP1864407.1 DNA-binding LacI/PurR family transcriptional regulator [Clostridium tetanomorphum]NRS83853.1 DNA-binding LacI/PurR family transcriptional regulator [Clostridium tetanomorphum]NRZ97040.1 DNA-binding LacI/PurR family transcriptional regulator [C